MLRRDPAFSSEWELHLRTEDNADQFLHVSMLSRRPMAEWVLSPAFFLYFFLKDTPKNTSLSVGGVLRLQVGICRMLEGTPSTSL